MKFRIRVLLAGVVLLAAVGVLACDLTSWVGTSGTPVVVVVTATAAPATQTPFIVLVTPTPDTGRISLPPLPFLATPTPTGVGLPLLSLPSATASPVLVVASPRPPSPTRAITPSPRPTATPRPTVTPMPTPNWVLTFSDDFSNPESGLSKSGRSPYYYNQGEYIVEGTKPGSSSAVVRDAPTFSDFALGVDARIADGPDNAALGVDFRALDPGNCYTVYIDGQGRYRVGKWVGSKWQDLTDWTPSPNIKKGKATNHLGILARGSAITILANSQPLITVQDAAFPQGALGLEAWPMQGSPSIKVAFDNLLVTTVSDTSPVTLFEDDFSSTASGWGEWRATGDFSYQQGEYIAKVLVDDESIFAYYASPKVSDLSLEVDVRLIEGQGESNPGVTFRFQDPANFYRFSVNANGAYRLNKQEDGEYQEIGPGGWTASPAIKTGTATNHLKVVAVGPQISVYANGERLTTVTDDTFDKGNFGFIAGRDTGPVTVAFDNLRLYTPAGTVPTVAPPPTAVPPTAAPSVPAGLAPGVYVNSVRVEPADLHNGQYPTFYVTFVNSTSGTLYYKWFVKLYEPDKRNSFGETTKVDSTLPAGTAQVASAANWRAPGTSPCRPFIARIFYQAPDGTILEFPKPGGDNFWFYFSVCG